MIPHRFPNKRMSRADGMAMAAAREALSDAGLFEVPGRLRSEIDVVVGGRLEGEDVPPQSNPASHPRAFPAARTAELYPEGRTPGFHPLRPGQRHILRRHLCGGRHETDRVNTGVLAMNVGEWSWKRARLWPERLFLRQGDRSCTNREFNKRVNRMANVLLARGVAIRDPPAHLC